jgi:hypothetical protein
MSFLQYATVLNEKISEHRNIMKGGHILLSNLMHTHIIRVALGTLSEVLVDSAPNPESALEDFLALRIKSCFLVQGDRYLRAECKSAELSGSG